jgi:hypothetical protein
MDDKSARVDLTFIVRVSCDDAGRLTGIVERARTGEKHRFRGVSGVATLIERMVKKEPRK